MTNKNTGLVEYDDYAQWSPAEDAEMSWDEFVAAGIGILDKVTDLFLDLGDLALQGWRRFRPDLRDNPQDRRAWTTICAKAWGCHRTTVDRAMTEASSPVPLPRDKTRTWRYMAASLGKGDADRTEELVQVAIREGWSAYSMRLACILRDEGLTDELVLPRLYRSGDRLVISDGVNEATVAWFEDDGRLSKAGARLLGLLARF